MDNENYYLIEINCNPTPGRIVLEDMDTNNELNRFWFNLSAKTC